MKVTYQNTVPTQQLKSDQRHTTVGDTKTAGCWIGMVCNGLTGGMVHFQVRNLGTQQAPDGILGNEGGVAEMTAESGCAAHVGSHHGNRYGVVLNQTVNAR